ncbi:Cellulose binding domain protein [Actinomadura rubteroloni]|uniref:Cellulose binding domain protein n=1 Tax=Actinomadura rubteroloni TaxID=1926885 RepID=A0A2P4UHW2_9ACTN|nr:cellulose binding domain-containing protein [Actinomadura rubteroloni]POM24606.1 Cellulose binding domain protein [Actinomadura rubteroloni]
MSGEESGYVPPDHRTTAEFALPGAPAADETLTDAPPATLTDAPLTGATVTDLPEDDPEPDEDAPATIVDRPVPEPGPWTAQFGAEDAAEPPAPPPVPVVAAGAAPPPPRPEVPGPPAAHAAPLPVPPVGHAAPPPDATLAPGLAPVPPPGPSGGRRGLLIGGGAALVLLLLIVGGVLVFANRSGDGTPKGGASVAAPPASPSGTASEEPGAPVAEPTGTPPVVTPTVGEPGVEPTPGEPTPGEPPAPVVTGSGGVTYQLVEQDAGYYEGRIVFTNTTGKPLAKWKLTFSAPDGNVKNVWGGRLVHGGAKAEIQQAPGAAPIPAGASFEVRFGVEGTPATPRDCRVNGRSCGF